MRHYCTRRDEGDGEMGQAKLLDFEEAIHEYASDTSTAHEPSKCFFSVLAGFHWSFSNALTRR